MYTVDEEYGQVYKGKSYLVRDSLIHNEWIKSVFNKFFKMAYGFYYSNVAFNMY